MSVFGGLGATFGVSLNGGSSYTTVAGVTEITTSWAFGTADTTSLATPITGKTNRPTMGDPGELTAKIYFDGAGTGISTLTGLMATGYASTNPNVLPYFKVTLTDGSSPTTYIVQGILTKFDLSGITDEGNLEADIAVKGSGAVTVALA